MVPWEYFAGYNRRSRIHIQKASAAKIGDYQVRIHASRYGYSTTKKSGFCRVSLDTRKAIATTIDCDLNTILRVKEGETISLSVIVSTEEWCTLSYQWYKNSSLSKDETNASLTLTNVTSLDEGDHQVKIFSSFGKDKQESVSSVCAVELLTIPLQLHSRQFNG